MSRQPQSTEAMRDRSCNLWVRRLWSLLAFCLAVPFAVWRMENSAVYEGAALPLLVSGGGHLPYQYRALVPLLVRLLSQVGAGGVLESRLLPFGLGRVSAAVGAPQDLAAIFLSIEILSAWGLLVSFRALAARFVDGEVLPTVSSIALLVATLGVQQLSPSSALWYPSDIPAMLVVVLSYLALFSGRIAAFYPLFVIGCLNRETVLFLLPLVALLPADVSRARWPWLHVSALFFVWGGIKTAMFFAYRGNHGYPVHPNIFVNLETLSSPAGAAAALGAACVLVALSVRALRRSGDARLKAALGAATLFLVSILFAGKLDEFRVYLELLPLVVLVLLATFSCSSWRPAS